MGNLYDKWVKADWEQLWADDHVAYIIIPYGNHYNVMMDDGLSEYEEDGFTLSEAFKRWNQLINAHLAYDRDEVAA